MPCYVQQKLARKKHLKISTTEQQIQGNRTSFLAARQVVEFLLLQVVGFVFL